MGKSDAKSAMEDKIEQLEEELDTLREMIKVATKSVMFDPDDLSKVFALAMYASELVDGDVKRISKEQILGRE